MLRPQLRPRREIAPSNNALGEQRAKRLQLRRHRVTEERFRGPLFVFNAATNQLPGVLMLIGAISLLATSGGGMYWLSGALVAAMISFFANAWVLLVEIVR